jgi:hypothetical protein
MRIPAFPVKPLAVALMLGAFAAGAQAPGDVRVALVIGNSSYASVPLLNPANDAKAMSETLRGLGFTVIEVRDGSKAQMADAIGKVRDSLQGKQGVGMLYYAGHGLQMDARNFMVPVDAKLSKAADVTAQTVEVGSVIEAFKTAGNRMNILVLDACRDNPFGGITTGKGLAPLDAPSGTFLAYATAPGNVAGDGDEKSGNGLYTQYLLQELKKPQASIENVFKRVRFAVRKASAGRQIPWESTSLEDDFQFNDGRVVALQRPTALQLQDQFSAEKQDWDRIKDSSNPDDFYAFLQKYPSGTITEAAHGRLNLLSKPTLTVQAPDGQGAFTFVPSLYRMGDSFSVRRSMTISGQPPAPPSEDTFRVASVNDREVAVNAQIHVSGLQRTSMTLFYTPDGANLGTNYSRYDPPQPYMPAGPLQAGQRWRIAYVARGNAGVQTLPVTGEGQIIGREKLTVPAGTYDTYKLQQTNNVNGMVQKCEVWVSPSVPRPVKTECNLASPGTPAMVLREELASYSRAG